MQFCYFDSELEVYSDEEGHTKGINGHSLGDARGALRLKMLKDREEQKQNEALKSETVDAPR